METFQITVNEVVFLIDADDEAEALSEVEGILFDYAHDYGNLEVS